MSKRARRQKARDVYNQSYNPFVGRTSKFSEAFPKIKNVRVTVEELDFGQHVRSYVYTESNLSEYIDCSNPRCYNGGFQIGDQLRFMTYSNEIEKEFEIDCQGYEGSPKGRRRYGPCDRSFKVRIELEYKAEESE
jgi:hypothetical protein